MLSADDPQESARLSPNSTTTGVGLYCLPPEETVSQTLEHHKTMVSLPIWSHWLESLEWEVMQAASI